MATPMRIESWWEEQHEAFAALDDVGHRAERSRDRVSHAHGISGRAGLRGPGHRDVLLCVGRDRGRGDRSRARRALGDLHLLGASEPAALLRRRARGPRDGRAAAGADRSRGDLPGEGAREPALRHRDSRRHGAERGTALQPSAGAYAPDTVRYRADCRRGTRGGGYAVQRDGSKHASRRAAAADVEPPVLRADRVRRGANDVDAARRTARRRGVALYEDSHCVRSGVSHCMHTRVPVHSRGVTSRALPDDAGPASPVAGAESRPLFDWLFVVAVVSMVAAYVRALFFTPIEALQGAAQKIYYVHVSAALSAYLALGVVALMSIVYLWLRD